MFAVVAFNVSPAVNFAPSFESGGSPFGAWKCCCSVSRRQVNGINNGGNLLLNSRPCESIRVFPSHKHRSNTGTLGICAGAARRESGLVGQGSVWFDSCSPCQARGVCMFHPQMEAFTGMVKGNDVPCHFCFWQWRAGHGACPTFSLQKHF